MHVVENVRRKEEKCSWWELTFSDVEKKKQSECFAEYSAVESVDVEEDDDDATTASSGDDASVVSRMSISSSISMRIRSKDKDKKKKKKKSSSSRSIDDDSSVVSSRSISSSRSMPVSSRSISGSRSSKDRHGEDGKKKRKSSRSLKPNKSGNLGDMLSRISAHSAPAPVLEEPSLEEASVEISVEVPSSPVKKVALPPAPPPPPTEIINTKPVTRMMSLRLHVGKYTTGKKESSRKANDSEDRKSLVKSSLYSCMEDDEDDYLNSFLVKAT
jgi:hypothetical protein